MFELSPDNNLHRAVDISKPEGLYTIVYGAHNKRTNLALLPSTLDGIVIEWPSHTGLKKPEYMSDFGRLFMPQFSTVLEYAERIHLPVYHTDLGLNLLPWIEMFLPWRPSTGLRNVIMAHKAEWMMRNIVDINHLGMVLGAGHNGIEDQLRRTPEDRIRSLRRLSIILKALTRRKTIPSISEYDFTGSEWKLAEVFEVQDLKDI